MAKGTPKKPFTQALPDGQPAKMDGDNLTRGCSKMGGKKKGKGGGGQPTDDPYKGGSGAY